MGGIILPSYMGIIDYTKPIISIPMNQRICGMSHEGLLHTSGFSIRINESWQNHTVFHPKKIRRRVLRSWRGECFTKKRHPKMMTDPLMDFSFQKKQQQQETAEKHVPNWFSPKTIRLFWIALAFLAQKKPRCRKWKWMTLNCPLARRMMTWLFWW